MAVFGLRNEFELHKDVKDATMHQEQSTGKPRPRVSAAQVARACGVSTATVSYVFNGKPGVSPVVRRHVIETANELGYRSPLTAAKHNRSLTRVIGLIVPSMLNYMHMHWAQAIIDAAAEEGFDVFVSTTGDDPERLAHVAASMAARNVDGVISTGGMRLDARIHGTLGAARIPVVNLSRTVEHADASFIGIDDAQAASELMGHVLGHGVTKVATVIGPRFSTASATREAAFIDTAAAHDVPVPGRWRVSTRLHRGGGRIAAEELLADPDDRPEAIVCGSDEVALGVIEHAVVNGIDIPGELIVVGSDGLARSRSPLLGLTTIVQPVVEMATTAFRVLLERITEPGTPARTVICPHQLHIGTSCGCHPEDFNALAAR
ncbi:LacI family transcriptional regulator [Brevibacterium casei]|uniref:LacI family DNA-binding transcriptional regulator n=1 Tax=Micrococcales TaxID=85006 RepID=UPI00103E3FE8|nr:MULTISPECIES: LacI family DNA-binding transcriptional regulator [Micrococcales]MCT1766755.1 LacI family transcriptional regulator [Brevibacterium casei]MCT2182824.1 LacI family transcriptional regulator [Brevibacterium casei]MDH5147958.1 LacI family DNA-binding transcriptional regulator [Brevibacterium casei]